MSGHLPRFSPDAKKKKHALPSLLSKIRNAQAVIGRAAADESHERETRPLVSALGGSGPTPSMAPANRPQLSRSAPSSSFAATVQNFSERFGSQWRKRSRRKKGEGVTVVPQSFFLAVGCFFFAFPLLFVLFILARHAVFGDEEDTSGATVHKHEVPATLGMTHESGKDLLDMKQIDADHPEDDLKMYNHLNLTSVHGDAAIGSQISEGSDLVIVPPADGLHAEAGQIIGDSQYQSESNTLGLIQTNIEEEDSTNNIMQHATMHNVTREGDINILAGKDIKSSNDLKEIGTDEPQQAAISLNNGLVDEVKAGSTFDQTKDEQMSHFEENPIDENDSRTNVIEGSNAIEANDVKLLRSREEND